MTHASLLIGLAIRSGLEVPANPGCVEISPYSHLRQCEKAVFNLVDFDHKNDGKVIGCWNNGARSGFWPVGVRAWLSNLIGPHVPAYFVWWGGQRIISICV